MPKPAQTARSERLNLRVTSAQARLIRLAAGQSRETTSAFLVESACLRAEQTLASQQHLLYSPKQWSAFAASLDRPPQSKARLKKLLSEPSILEKR